MLASFITFAVDQTKSASTRQQAQLAGNEPATSATTPTPAPEYKSGLHRTIDDISSEVTSPFSGVVSSSSEWTTRSVKLLLALLVYGFGLGYLARAVRVRA